MTIQQLYRFLEKFQDSDPLTEIYILLDSETARENYKKIESVSAELTATGDKFSITLEW